MVNISKLKLTSLQSDILRLLFINARKSMNAREIAQSLNVSQPAVSKALPLLEKEFLILLEKDTRSRRLSITLNREEHEVLWLKRIDNLKQIYESGLVQLLNDSLPGATVILFGSYSNGEDDVNSDIDLAVIGVRYIELELKKIEDVLKRKIVINNYESFKKIDKHLLNNILNGIILKGAVDL